MTLVTVWVFAAFSAQPSAPPQNAATRKDRLSFRQPEVSLPVEAFCEQTFSSADSSDDRTLGSGFPVQNVRDFAAPAIFSGILEFRTSTLNSSHLLEQSPLFVRAP